MAEAITNTYGGSTAIAFSAGSKPVGKIHKKTKEVLKEKGYDIKKYRSKSWKEFSDSSPVRFDVVIAVCEQAGSEACPTVPGEANIVSWHINDPAKAKGSEEEKLQAFRNTYDLIQAKIEKFFALPIDSMNKNQATKELEKLAT